MKTSFAPDEFIQMLESIGAIIDVLIKSRQYQELTNDEDYGDYDFTLVDAKEAVEQCATAFEEMQAKK